MRPRAHNGCAVALITGGATPAVPLLDQPDAVVPVPPPTPQTLVATATGGHGRRTGLWLALVVVLVAGAVALGIANRHTVAHQIALSVSHQPTPFTELYFNQPDALPTAVAPPGPGRFGFTIANHQGHATAYAYTVTLASTNGAAVAARGTVQVADGRSTTEPVTFYPPSEETNYVVTVTLADRSETIHFGGTAP